MNNKNTEKPFVLELFQTFTTTFTLSVLAISITSLLVIHFTADIQDIPALFASGNTFIVILQIAGFAFIMAFFCVLIITERFIFKMRFWLRLLLLLFLAMFTFAVFAIIFNWFPTDNLQTWIGFVICTIISYIFSICLTLLKFKLEGKKYDKLLTNYKERKNYPAR